MPDKKTIAQLFEESIERGLDTYEHVAKEIWGTCNVTTRRLAQEVCFGIMYGQQEARQVRSVSDSELAKLRDIGVRWRMTDEELTEQADAQQVDSAVFVDWVPGKMRQSEDRMHRAGVSTYKVEVFDDAGNGGPVYTVRATSTLDARCIAFVIDGGCSEDGDDWDDEDIELALRYTVIV